MAPNPRYAEEREHSRPAPGRGVPAFPGASTAGCEDAAAPPGAPTGVPAGGPTGSDAGARPSGSRIAACEPGRSDCFITSACVSARGLSEDCDELTLLRLFRSGYVAQLPEGPEVLAEYREKAPKVVAAVEALGDEASMRVWNWVYGQILEALALIGEGRFEAAYQLYAEVCMQLEARFLPGHDQTTSHPPENAPGANPEKGERS
jgi:hypothetical protein